MHRYNNQSAHYLTEAIFNSEMHELHFCSYYLLRHSVHCSGGFFFLLKYSTLGW